MLHTERLAKTVAALRDRGSSAVFIGPGADLIYMCGLGTALDERVKGLVVTDDGTCGLLAPMLYKEEMLSAVQGAQHVETWSDHEGPWSAWASLCSKLGLSGASIEINAGLYGIDVIEMQRSFSANYKNGADLLSDARSKKDCTEIEMIRHASAIADRVMEDIAGYLRSGLSEDDIKIFLTERARAHGSEGMSFSPIVASGANASRPHYSGGAAVLREGELVIIDMGFKWKGYCSDITRTFCVGSLNEEMERAYQTVLSAQKAGCASARAGISGEDVDRITRSKIEEDSMGQYFITRTGHGIGLEVHEGPYIVKGNSKPLEAGNIFSIEPGVYVEGKYGIRIEDLVAIDGDGRPEILNRFTKELIYVK